jgi:hypothetical protein
MDWTGLAITVGILVYGILVYQRREQKHRVVLAYLRRGEEPPDSTEMPGLVRLVAVAVVGVWILAGSVTSAVWAVQHGKVNVVTVLVAVIFLLLFGALVKSFVIDVRRFTTAKAQARRGAL